MNPACTRDTPVIAPGARAISECISWHMHSRERAASSATGWSMKRSSVSSKAPCTRSLSEPWRPKIWRPAKIEAKRDHSRFAALWLAGAHIDGNGNHVGRVQLLDDGF